MKNFGDNQIRKLFEELRRSDRESAPPLAEVVNGRPVVSPWLSLPVRLALALWGVALLVVMLWVGKTTTDTPKEMASLSAWRAPTDFLLVLPGSELLGQPRLSEGEAIAWSATPIGPTSFFESGSQEQKEAPEKR